MGQNSKIEWTDHILGDALDYDTIMKGAEMHAFLHWQDQIVTRARERKPGGRKKS